MNGVLTRVAGVLGWTLLLMLVVLAPLFGSIASVVASVCALLLIPVALRRDARQTIARQPTLWLFGFAFVALGVAFAVTAQSPQDVRYIFNFLALPLAAVVYAAAWRVGDGEQAMRTVATACLAGAVICLVASANDVLLLGQSRPSNPFMGPNTLARLALVLGFVALGGLFVVRSRWRWVFYLAPVAGVLAIYLSGTRGALLALPVQGLILVGFLVADRRSRREAIAITVLGLLAVVLMLVGSQRFGSLLDVAAMLIGGGASPDGSVSERVAMISAATQLFAASPFIGHGWAHFAAIAYPLIGSAVWGGPTDPFFQFHSDIANFAVAAGTVGLLSLVALWLAPIAGALSSERDSLFPARLYCCLQLSAATVVSGLTDFTLGYDLPTTLYAFLTTIVLGAVRKPPASPDQTRGR